MRVMSFRAVCSTVGFWLPLLALPAAAEGMRGCPQLPAAGGSAQTQALIAEVSHGTALAAGSGLWQRVVEEGNRLADAGSSPVLGERATAVADLIGLEAALAERQHAGPSSLVTSEQIHLRLSISKIYFTAGCQAQAHAVLSEGLDLPAALPVDRAALLVNLAAADIDIDDLPQADKRLAEALRIVPNAQDYESAKVRLGALDAKARLLRKSGDRQGAIEQHRLSSAMLQDKAVIGFFAGSMDEYDEILANELTNRAILLGYEQKDADEAGKLFVQAEALLSRTNNLSVDTKVGLMLALSDHALDMGDRTRASELLSGAVDLLQDRPSRPQVLLRVLRKRASLLLDLGHLDAAEADLSRAEGLAANQDVGPFERAKISSLRGDLLAARQQGSKAIAAHKEALGEMRNALPESTLEVAMEEQLLSLAFAKAGDFAHAIQWARSADEAVSAWLAGEASGCRAGTAANAGVVALIREWRGVMSEYERRRLRDAGASERELQATDRDILALVQEREFDRVGVAAMRTAMRRGSAEDLRAYGQALASLCAARTGFDAALQADRAPLGSAAAMLNGARKGFAAAEAQLPTDLRTKFAEGHLVLQLEDLATLLRDGEAIVAFRVGSQTTATFVARREGANLVTGSSISKGATRGTLEQAVSTMLSSVQAPASIEGPARALDDMLQLGATKAVLDGAKHIFVVSDGALQRLPPQLLPIGADTLGDIAPISALSSVSMLAAIRSAPDGSPRRRSVMGIGAPALNQDGCSDAARSAPPDTIDRIRCLGSPVGSDKLLSDVRSDLGGPPPIVGAAATLRAVKSTDFSVAGVLLMATHGLVGGNAFSKLPAVVLTPDPTVPGDNGLLTTQDVAALDLDHIWLAVLAACSTAHAAPDSVDEGLSGLGLAFTSAGANALMLTYWDAESTTTRTIIKGVFDRMAADPQLTLSQALDQQQKEFKAKKYPIVFWAPFVVIGDGNITLPAH